MADMYCTSSVTIRDERGRFLSRLHDKERAAAELLAAEAVATARALAPKRTGGLAGSISSTSGSSGFSWSVSSRHWAPQEYGARPHPITGWVNFFWEREGRPWVPGGNLISHPGNRGIHFMQRTYDLIAPKVVDTMRNV